ncbi:MAG: PorT family protein [Bacteroidia bacterium]|nr:PorT family protein [Bacteroidia bacterium]
MKYRSLFLIMICPVAVWAQSGSNKKINVPKLIDKQDKLILNLTSDNWMNLPAGIKAKPFRSRGFSFLLMGERLNTSGNVGIGMGFGISSQNVHTNGSFDDVTDPSKTTFNPIPDSMDYDLNKLSLNYVDLALELRFRTNENADHKRFKISAGIKGGILFQEHSKYKDSHGKIKSYGLDHLNSFQYGITGRIGYGTWAVTGYYALNGIFKKDKGPDLIPYSVGISLTP